MRRRGPTSRRSGRCPTSRWLRRSSVRWRRRLAGVRRSTSRSRARVCEVDGGGAAMVRCRCEVLTSSSTRNKRTLRSSSSKDWSPRRGTATCSGSSPQLSADCRAQVAFSSAVDFARLEYRRCQPARWFGSCHMPVHHSLLTPQGGEEPERAALQMLESQGGLSVDRVDMLLLTGDQIYADGISASRLRITLRHQLLPSPPGVAPAGGAMIICRNSCAAGRPQEFCQAQRGSGRSRHRLRRLWWPVFLGRRSP